jgi:hypothetical protein
MNENYPKEDAERTSRLFEAAQKCMCDFCNSTSPRWAYPASDFPIAIAVPADGSEPRVAGSSGPWAACDACAVLIEKNDYDALLVRSLEAQPIELLEAMPPALVRAMLSGLHATFKKARTGPRMEIA